MASNPVKPLVWIASSKKDLGKMPGEVQDVFGFALYQAQIGKKPGMATPLKGFGSAAVIEVVEDWMGDTFRAVYTAKFANAVYVLHCFQKKSSKGIATPKPDLALIRERFKAAKVHARGNTP
jgi:phage-related protein